MPEKVNLKYQSNPDWNSLRRKEVLIFTNKSFIRGIIAASSLGASALALADDVHFIGSTLGRFNSQPFSVTNSLLDLTYANSTFDIWSVNNQLDLGGDPVPAANINNLGSFTLGLLDATYDGNMFQLMINFTAPATIAGGSNAIYTDHLFGTVRNLNGGVFIDFGNNLQTFTFSNSTATGSFSLLINNVSIAPGHSSSLTGHIIASQQPVPEPFPVIGLACGTVGLILFRRKPPRF